MTNDDFYKKLKWLTFFRVLFTTLLLGSTIILQVSETSSFLSKPLLALYRLLAGIFVLSFCYSLILKIGVDWVSNKKTRFFLLTFAYIQTSIDTFIVTLIIFMTGSFSSVFSFLYLVVIIYVSMLIFRKGSMIIAALCSIQYGVMVDLEFYGLLDPYGFEAAYYYPWSHVLFKIIMIMVACFAVAFLSSLLAEQERKTKKELLVMEDHVKRVEQMAAVGEMAAGLAHEIKNPIASLRGSIQLLREDIPYDPDHDKLMRIVMREADRLSSLVTDFLLFARPPAGNREFFDLGEALTETVAIFEKDIICRGRIFITTDIIPRIHIEMDPSHLHQIFWNLLLNAAEAIEDSGDIHIEMHLLKNKQVAIRVIDNGCGMSKETMKTMFNPFVTTKPQGTGLGLSIVHRIVESYNGRLDVESERGKGTVFTLILKYA